MEQLGLPLNLQTQEGQDKATLTKCKCVKDKRLRVTRKRKNAQQKPDQLGLFDQEPTNETRR